MKFEVKKTNLGLWRVCVQDGGIAMTGNGRPVDGGGHKTRKKAERQKQHIEDWYNGSRH